MNPIYEFRKKGGERGEGDRKECSLTCKKNPKWKEERGNEIVTPF